MRFINWLRTAIDYLIAWVFGIKYEPEIDFHDYRTDRGDGTCFHCHQPLTDKDKGPDGRKQICNTCLADLRAEREQRMIQAHLVGDDVLYSLQRAETEIANKT